MSIDFLNNDCKTHSNKNEFGLCDDPPPSKDPAYIDEVDNENWIAIIKNKEEKEVDFIAVDACIDIRRQNGELESRCDGIISYENNLIFVELKYREGGAWLKKGREQLTITIEIFKMHHDITKFEKVSGSVCNSLRPQSHSGHGANIQQFFDETGLILKADQIIEI